MPFHARPHEPLMPIRQARLVPGMRDGDALDEFALENSPEMARLIATLREVSALEREAPGGSLAAVSPRVRRRPVVHVRYRAAAAVAASITCAVGVTAWLVVNADTPGVRGAVAAERPSPVKVLYPDYTGATSLLQAAAAALSAVLTAEAPGRSTRSAPESNPLLQARLAPGMGLEPQLAFDVRGALPQAAVADAQAAPFEPSDRPGPADAPPRRLGPPLTVTMLGGAFPATGRLALLLDVTGDGDVARVVTEEAIDVHDDVIDSVSAAARAWKYQPARRDGSPVPARVRVVVHLRGAE